MQFYSTNNPSFKVDLRRAVTEGLAPDNGLYMPEKIPVLPSSFFHHIHQLSFQEIGFTVAQALFGGDIPEIELRKIIEHTLQFEAPLVPLDDHIYSLELFHGPTLAFKDFGARFMSRLLGYFAQQQEQEIVILVATSGDTGSAVANGFLHVPGTRVVVLYPSGKVSDIQEKQFTTLGENILALEVEGTFDDCQRLVKQAFLDQDLQRQFFLTSANSINIARLIPQSFYYFRAYAQLAKVHGSLVVSVPSGNFGNLMAGLIAKRMGLPVTKFVASTNINDIVPEYLRTQYFSPRPSAQTISNAMDVGNPSNLARIQDLYHHDLRTLKEDVEGYAFTDEETRAIMQQVYIDKGYVLDPHGAIGYLGLKKYLEENNAAATGIFLETAHPAKFKNVVEETLGEEVSVPPTLQAFLEKKKQTILLHNDFKNFKEFLIQTL
jgi:threonine synthase